MIPLNKFDIPVPNPGILLLLGLPPESSAAEVAEAWEKTVRSKAAGYFKKTPADRVKEIAMQIQAETGVEWNIAWASVKAKYPSMWRSMEGNRQAGAPWIGADLAAQLTPAQKP